MTRHAPDVKVHTTFDPADEPGTGHEDLRVRELYENQLRSLCEPYAGRLRAAAGR